MTNNNTTLNLTVAADRLVALITHYISVGDWPSVQKYEQRLRRCRALLAQTQTPGF